MLAERVLAQLQISTSPNGSSIAALATALDEPAVFVRFALQRLRGQGDCIPSRGLVVCCGKITAHA
jgi:hypothetical protein